MAALYISIEDGENERNGFLRGLSCCIDLMDFLRILDGKGVS